MFDLIEKQTAAMGYRFAWQEKWSMGTLAHWRAIPDRPRSDAPPLVAVHGLHRGAKGQAVALGSHAARKGQSVIAPLFGRNDWPHYQQAVHKRRADLALLGLLDDLRMTGTCPTGKVELCGYSGGAQFAHRFAMLYPHRIARLTLVAAGWYTFPDAAPFPFGLGTPSRSRAGWHLRQAADLRPFLALPIRVVVGAEDNVVDENTRTGADIDAQQGRTRLERARRWVASLEDTASRLRLTPDITLTELDGCGHDFRQCLTHPGTQRALFAHP